MTVTLKRFVPCWRPTLFLHRSVSRSWGQVLGVRVYIIKSKFYILHATLMVSSCIFLLELVRTQAVLNPMTAYVEVQSVGCVEFRVQSLGFIGFKV